jgi:RNA polymerase sigma-70 factor (ECF subfamily)
VESIYRYVLVRVRHQEDAEDITAEVFVKVMAALPRFQWRDVPFLAWVYRIAHNQVASHQRRGLSRPVGAAIENLDFVDPGNGPDWLVEQKVTMEEVSAAIKQLPEAQRQVIELRFAAGLSVRETAQALNKNENNVKVLQFKAIERLRKLLPRGEPEGGSTSGDNTKRKR